MTTEEQKNELLEQFKHYLEQDNQSEVFEKVEQPDLNTLLSELTGLKTEVKTGSRQYKNTLETLNTALATMQEDNAAMSAELTMSRDRVEQKKNEVMRAMLLEMIDIYDRLSIGLGVLENYRPTFTFFKRSRDKDINFIRRFKDGQVMTVKRFEQLLQRHQVSAIESVGNMLDPVTMTALETENNPKIENGIVVEELRKGFLYENQVLRLAEVKVNRISY